MGGTIFNLGSTAVAIGGVEDHVHLLVSLGKESPVMPLVREVKKAATNWIQDEIGIKQFAWQEGYAALGVSPERVPSLIRYIANQEEHHHNLSSKMELEELLRTALIEYEPKYLE